MKAKKIIHALTGAEYLCGPTFRGTFCGKTLLLATPATSDPTKATCKACLKRIALLDLYPQLAGRIDEMASTPEGQHSLNAMIRAMRQTA